MQHSAPKNNTKDCKWLGGYRLTVEPGKPQKLYVGTYQADEPRPCFRIEHKPHDSDALAHEYIELEQRDGSYRLYFYFENYGQTTAEVTLRRVA